MQAECDLCLSDQEAKFLKDKTGKKENNYIDGCLVYSRLSHEGPRPMGGMPSVGVFLRDPSPYLREFRRIHGKLRTARSTSVTED